LGLFKQVFEKNLQKETENSWITEKSWLRKQEETFTVQFGGFALKSVLYDMDVVGYENRVNSLHLFDIEEVDEKMVQEGIDFDKSDVKKNLTLFLYPDDSTEEGRLLRVYQQYFMVSCGAQLILKQAKARGCKLHDLADYVTVQINDTHPSMVIPELIRLLMAEGIDIKEAISIVEKTCAYTNHTILAEALEKWPMHYLETVAPAIVPIIRVLDAIKKAEYAEPSLAIIDNENRVHMANMDIHYGYSVNGVAYLHTEILKNNELKQFYDIYPEKFNNKTNGITFRRWLLHCNPALTALLDEQIGTSYRKDAENLKHLLDKKDNEEVLNRMLAIKHQNKQALAAFVKETQGIELNTNGIFDIQVKRLHEYKRQQLNILYGIHKYLEIKAGKKPSTPIVMIFGAKAAPAYTIAKDIIHLILCMQELIEKDEEVKPYLQIVMLENYNVTKAELVIPACDISEQISLASKEASGTGNMKFMLNGAITLGTEDGANVEIHELVGDENIYVFGEDSDTVIARYERGDYCAKDYIEKNEVIKEAVEFIVSDELMEIGSEEHLIRLHDELVGKDWFMTFPDMEDYIATKERAYADYEDRKKWAGKMLVNTAMAGFFSSDRTIAEYNKDIWKL
jgi:starch phosphorylase